MTIIEKCDKMFFMKTLRLKKFIILFLIISLFASVFAFFWVEKPKVFADGGGNELLISKEFLLPEKIEYLEIITPMGAVKFDNGIAVSADKKVHIYNGNAYTTLDYIADASQIKLFNDRYLFVLNNSSIYPIDLTNFNTPSSPLKFNAESINCVSFDVSGNTLITQTSGSSLIKYAINNDLTVSSSENVISGAEYTPDDKKPVAINSNGDIFFIHSNTIYVKTPNGETPVEIANGSGVNSFLTTPTHLYYTTDTLINRCEFDGSAQTLIKTNVQDKNFDIGNVQSPVSISSYNDKLIITDKGICAITEFIDENDTLTYTGFAVASGKTAYNRFPNATNLALDNDKLTVISGTEYTEITLENNMVDSERENYRILTETDATPTPNHVDLFGNEFTVNEKDFCFNGQVIASCLSNITAFAVDKVNSTVYYLLEGSEFIYKTDLLKNASISKLVANQKYNEFKAFKVNENTQIYKAKLNGEKFIYSEKDIISGENEYVFITSASCDSVSGERTYYYLANANQTILVWENDLVEITSSLVAEDLTASPKTVYISTPVYLYELPLLVDPAKDGNFVQPYAVKDQDKLIRLNKGEQISALKKFDFMGISYYKVKVNVNDKQLDGYIPLNFTTETPENGVNVIDFYFERVSKTTVYLDKELTQELFVIESDTTVKVLENVDGVCHVIVDKDGASVEGYLPSSALLYSPDHTLRNILIVLTTLASLCGTATFFILRKKPE